MYRVLLVDDEPWVLRGLKDGIPWERLGFEICSQTTDPSEALAILLEDQPELVVTDIKMPGTSGMDLIRCSREQGGSTNFIIFSGYNDFEYAQRAIHLGVFAYLLKPLNQDEFVRTLLLLEKSLKTPSAAYQTDGYFFLDGNIPIPTDFFKKQSETYCALTCYLTFSDALILEGIFSAIPHTQCRTGSNKYLYIFSAGQETVAALIKNFLESEECREKDYLTFGLSENFQKESEMPSAIRKSESAAGNHFLYPEKQLNFYIPANITCCNAWLDAFALILQKNETDQAAEAIRQLEDFCRNQKLTLFDFGYLHNRILALLEKTNDSLAAECPIYSEIPQKYADFQEACNFLTQILYDLRTLKPPHPKNEPSETFEEILQYIQEHYGQDITLTALSERFFLNMTYICDLFKKYQNTTFSKYLSNLRLEEAYRLISLDHHTLQEIAETVGYRDYYYFIKQFKKKYGITPGNLQKNAERTRINETSMEH